METGTDHFAYQYGGLSQIFKLIVSASENINININVVVRRQMTEKQLTSGCRPCFIGSREFKI